jgi:hypothetical protein
MALRRANLLAVELLEIVRPVFEREAQGGSRLSIEVDEAPP